jgi:hypothetical protein
MHNFQLSTNYLYIEEDHRIMDNIFGPLPGNLGKILPQPNIPGLGGTQPAGNLFDFNFSYGGKVNIDSLLDSLVSYQPPEVAESIDFVQQGLAQFGLGGIDSVLNPNAKNKFGSMPTGGINDILQQGYDLIDKYE